MVSTMIRAVNEVSSHSKNNFLEDLNPLSRLLPCKSVEEMKSQLIIFLATFCKHMNKINKCSSNWVVNDVVPFIEENYNDINLSVAVLAEKFDVHPVYISKVFKDEVGDGLLDFINRTRISNSLILLKERKDCNLDEISKEVGFSNVRTFSRVFKKYEGIAPGKFKNMI
ncbi:helix-turn-helix transcriptional regulator [Clostridium lacusfryxellense]|uniref:helix-turn-helix transcriptional regulator n=1 Tax=Clostridium lacusfryxellense TaxID=205328 RepID=UPI001C0DDEE0|nr:helix-turn-helix transcriptional regulator [Clostridium lacusfryxellense]MBU3113175.1 helix-turn-helix transcriptional regulator [Clostridium lacusfryxellense]